MRFAFFTELYPPSVGGQEIRFAEMASLLVTRGHSVTVFCVNELSDGVESEVVDGVQIHRYPTAVNYRKPLIAGFRRSLIAILKYGMWCRTQASGEFDACIYNQWPLCHIMLAPRVLRRVAIADWCEARGGFTFAIIQRYLPRLTRANMAVSVAVKRHMERASGRSFAYIPSGIHSARYRCLPKSSRRGLLYIGRLAKHKNLELLLQAYEATRMSGYSGELIIAGDGPEKGALAKKKQQSPFSSDIQLLGYISEERKLDLLSAAEELVISSKREGFPRIVAEAMASGLPIVTVDFAQNGTKDIVEYYQAGIVTPSEPRALADGILSVLGRWSQYSEAGLMARSSLDWEVVLKELFQALPNGESGKLGYSHATS